MRRRRPLAEPRPCCGTGTGDVDTDAAELAVRRYYHKHYGAAAYAGLYGPVCAHLRAEIRAWAALVPFTGRK